jgi:hypothetical protein
MVLRKLLTIRNVLNPNHSEMAPDRENSQVVAPLYEMRLTGLQKSWMALGLVTAVTAGDAVRVGHQQQDWVVLWRSAIRPPTPDLGAGPIRGHGCPG